MKKKDMNNQNCKIRRITFLCLAVICLVGIAIFAYIQTHKSPSIYQTVATISGNALSYGELKFIMEKNRGPVYTYFSKKFAANINDEKFWQNTYSGENPTKYLKESALKYWVNVKIRQAFAKENGVIKDISYKAFLNEMKNENAQRKTAIENNQVIMGLREFDEYTYLNDLMDKIDLTLRKNLRETLFKTSDDEINAYYEKVMDEKFKKMAIMDFYEIHFPLDPNNPENTEGIKSLAEKALDELKSGADFETVAKKYNKDGKLIEDQFNEQSIKVYQKVYDKLIDVGKNLKVGECSGIVQEDGLGLYIIKCMGKKEQGYEKLKDVREKIIDMIVEEKYDLLINNLVETVKIDLVDKKLWEEKG